MELIEITVSNKTRDQVWRGGYVFEPRSKRAVMADKTAMAEIKACRALRIEGTNKKQETTRGKLYPCDHPGCSFSAKNPGALAFHQKKHEK